MAIPNFDTYSKLVYTLQDKYPSIQHSTLVLAPMGRTLSRLEGQITFEQEFVLDIWEFIDYSSDEPYIRHYSYEIYHAGEKIAWYDPFPHPHMPELASTHPHHKHVQPDIKNNRIPAPGISFDHPNVLQLIEEIVTDLLAK